MSEATPMQQYYAGKTVFITGASGFMGKVLLEKLLYSCHGIKEIIIVVRPKRGKVPETRMEEMFKLPMFQRIRDEKPEVLKKITCYQGDVTFDTLGLSGDALKHVLNNTNIVFHLAATLKLEGNLKDAINFNLSGTRRTLDLAKQMKHLEAFVHLSTAFCNCDQEVMYEKVYEFPHKPEDLMRLAEWMDVRTLDTITPDLLKPHPNTYTYSKRLAEILVRDHYDTMPVMIARPSIVTPALEEPLPGWVDNMNGPTGVLIGAGKGVIRSMLCNGDLNSEIIPVDTAINGLIILPFYYKGLKEKPKQIPVLNITVPDSKKHTWKWVIETGRTLYEQYPFAVALWYPDGCITTNKIYHYFNVICSMWLPALFIDCLLTIFGQRRFMIRVQKRIAVGLEVLQFFTTRQWDFKNNNFQELENILTKDERKIFRINVDNVDETQYLTNSLLGGRQYVAKDPLSTIPRARKQMKIMYVLDRVCKILFIGFFVYWIMSKFHIIEFLTEA